MRLNLAIGTLVLSMTLPVFASDPVIYAIDSGQVTTTNPIVAYLDGSGNYWVSTEDGLAVNDGATWHDVAEHPAFRDKIVRYIADNGNGLVWFGTGYEVIRLNTTNDTFEVFSRTDGRLPVERHQEVLVDSAGTAYIVSAADVYKFNSQTSKFERLLSFGDDSTPMSLPRVIGNDVLVSILGQGLFKASLTLDAKPVLIADDAAAKDAYAVVQCGRYFGVPFSGGFAVYDGGFKNVGEMSAKHPVSASCDSATGRLYFGGVSIFTWDPSSRAFTPFGQVDDINDNPWLIVSALPGKGIWASSYTGRTYFAAFRPIAKYYSLPNVKRVNAVIEDRSTKALLIATNAGLSRFDTLSGAEFPLVSDAEVYTVGRLNSEIWAASGKRLYIVRNGGEIDVVPNPDGVGTPASAVFTLSNGYVASFPSHGVFRYQGGSWAPFIPVPEQVKSGLMSYVWIVHIESEDSVQVQTHGRGIYRLTASTGLGERLTTDIGVLDYQPARAISLLGEEVFLSTEGGLVFHYDPATYTYKKVMNTPRSSRCVAKNDNGYLYVSANHGVLFETPLRAIYLQEGQFGIAGNSLTGDSCSELGEGRFAISTRNGFLVLNPENAVPIAADPIEATFVEVNGFKAFTRGAATAKGPVRSLKVWLSSRNPIAANVGVKFARLKSEPSFALPTTSSAIEFHNLDAGENLIRVSNDPNFEVSRNLLTLSVQSPWYLDRRYQLSAVGIASILGIALLTHLFFYFRERGQRRLLEEAHSFLIHELRSPLTALIVATESSPGRAGATDIGLLQYMRCLVDESLDKLRVDSGLSAYFEQRRTIGAAAYQPVQSALEVMRASVQPLLQRQNASLRIATDDESKRFASPIGLLERVGFNLVSNAIKASTDGEVVVTCSVNDRHLVFGVQDSGRRGGIGAAKWLGTGLGSKVTDRICQSVGAETETVENESGRLVVVRIPLEALRATYAKVLLVDDDSAFVGRLLSELGERSAATVEVALTVEQALSAMRDEPGPSLVVTDWRIGLDTADAVLSEATKRKMKAVILHGGVVPNKPDALPEIDKLLGIPAIVTKLLEIGLPLRPAPLEG